MVDAALHSLSLSHKCSSACWTVILLLISTLLSLLMKSFTIGGGEKTSKHSSSTHPSAQESKSRWSQPATLYHLLSSNLPLAPIVCSGAKYLRDPAYSSVALQRPKSMMTGSPSMFWRRILSGLMSRWAKPVSCICFKPRHSPLASRLTGATSHHFFMVVFRFSQ